MKWDLSQLVQILNADHEVSGDKGDRYCAHVFRFVDSRLKYELHVLPNNFSAQLAFDPDKPIQGCPMLEYGFNCTEIEIGPSVYGDVNAVRFYEHRESRGGLRLSLTPRGDGTWYTWANSWQDPPDRGKSINDAVAMPSD